MLVEVTEARAAWRPPSRLTPELLNDPKAFEQFQAAQGQLTGALKTPDRRHARIIRTSSPDANFRDLQAQLEGTENRIAVARNRYIDAVKDFNVTVREFPTNLTAEYVRLRREAQFHACRTKPPFPPRPR